MNILKATKGVGMYELENLRKIVEIGILALLAISLLVLIYLYINRRAAFKFAISQLQRFENKKELEIELHRKMSFIYSLASNSVYIGLFGTVIGIMITLQNVDIGSKKELIASLSIPLISTAASIIVAIIGNFIYNALVADIETILRKWDVENGG